MAPPAPRVLALGLDACEPRLIRRWAAAGELPFLARLMAETWTAPLEGPPGLFVGATWPSLVTGTSPARHEAYCHIRPRPGDYRDQDFRSKDIAAPALWQTLSRAGGRCLVLDSPWSPILGAGDTGESGSKQAGSWGSHDSNHFETWPPTWADELRARYGKPLREPCDAVPHTDAGLETMVSQLVRRIETRVALLEHELDAGAWDLVWAIFSEAHCAGHQLWHLHDEAHPHHPAALRQRLGEDPFLSVYRALDRALERLADRAGPDTHLVVFASHGVGPELGAAHLFPMILDRLEGRTPGLPARLFRLARAAWRSLPPGLRAWTRVPNRHVVGARQAADERDRPTRRCYFLDNNTASGAIRINLAGREPAGRVAPGAEYDALCAELIGKLWELRDEATGKPVVRRAYRVDELYPGPGLGVLPDILLDFDQTLPVAWVVSPDVGRVGGSPPVVRSGDHPVEARGLLCVRGPGVAAATTGAPVACVDLAPTIAHWLGHDLGEVDGRPVPGLTGVPAGPPRAGWLGHVDGVELPALRWERPPAVPGYHED